MVPDIHWAKTYKDLGLEREYSKGIKSLLIPSGQNLWVMPVVYDITSNKLVAGCRKLGLDFYIYAEDLDEVVQIHDRDPNRDGSYVVGFRRNIEADEENKAFSTNQLRARVHKGITLLERLLLGAGFYVTTGRHLDDKTRTLCSGSRYRGGGVPSVDWHEEYGEVCIYWYGPDDSFEDLRSRSVVPLIGQVKSS